RSDLRVISHASCAAEKTPLRHRVLCPSGLTRSPALFFPQAKKLRAVVFVAIVSDEVDDNEN
ncbi:hypothetical protein A1A1_18767, partial [Planococcus antarcticus DSM 14505]